MTTDQGPAEEAADWGSWLAHFQDHIWEVFKHRRYAKHTAAIIYFTRVPNSGETVDDEDEE